MFIIILGNKNWKKLIGTIFEVIIFSLFSLIILKKYYDKLKYSLIIVIALGMSVYFIEVFKSPYGLTPFGIISFSSIGFFPVYFSLKKTKKGKK